ncbi:3-hydroxybutyrate dehydrogenase [Mammaliicoccus sciuri]|uniref:3-hydroxybutyrate dehydrogenase n=1 Tax=Mammaliicoccus sciuri TaxID=1296 RepID=UPI001E5F6D68|nr:3-hydroxybutyrate dehydrogenase [Mammaliicoccus sciuri]MCD8801529.1 3-hydroxybutyrate dehydrogenase [Mammaliicoccus sciuri]
MLKDKVTIISGSASGIGLEIAKEFLNQGAKVVFTDINKTNLDNGVRDFKSKGFDCIGIPADVSNEDDVINLVDETEKHYGRIDVLVNNAGLQHVSNIEDFPTAKFKQMIDIMLVGTFIMTKHVLSIMKKQQFGRILNMSSINGVIGFSGKSAYNSAKHGIIGLTKVTALETAEDGITVNAICPGYIDTPLVRGQMEDLAKTRNVSVDQVLDEVLFPMIPQKRLVDIQDVADYSVFIASDKAKSVTGQSILIDGGYTAQ